MRYRCPHNTAVQVYKYAEKTARVVFGPDMVVLGPHEDFNVLSLSGKNFVKLHGIEINHGFTVRCRLLSNV